MAWHLPWRRKPGAGGKLLEHGAVSPQPGVRFASYLLQRQLGRGSTGVVYAALDIDQDHQPVALKLLTLGADAEPTERDEVTHRFLQEARIAATLQHPHIAAVHAAGQWQGQAYLAMELLPGSDLSRYTRASRLLPEPVVLRVAARVAHALAHAHQRGVLHRDIKPGNVMLDLSRDQVKVLDFGLARLDDAARSRSGLLIATPAYMSPEQAAGAALDARSDLYALGVMLYELLTGRLPFEAASMGQLLLQIARGEPEPLQRLRPDLPPALVMLVAELLARQPDQRPEDGEAVAAQLHALADAWATPPPDTGRAAGPAPL